jgi:hypothetical protein
VNRQITYKITKHPIGCFNPSAGPLPGHPPGDFPSNKPHLGRRKSLSIKPIGVLESLSSEAWESAQKILAALMARLLRGPN